MIIKILSIITKIANGIIISNPFVPTVETVGFVGEGIYNELQYQSGCPAAGTLSTKTHVLTWGCVRGHPIQKSPKGTSECISSNLINFNNPNQMFHHRKESINISPYL